MNETINDTPRHPWPLALRVAVVGLTALAIPAGAAINVLGWGKPLGLIGITVIAAGTLALPRVIMSLFVRTKMPAATARYMNRLLTTMIIYMGALFGSLALYRMGYTAGPQGYFIALLPALPVVGIFVIIGFLLKESDEFVRAVLLEGTAWSAALSLAEATIWGFLETFNKVPHVWMWAVAVAFFAQLGITMPLVQRKYR